MRRIKKILLALFLVLSAISAANSADITIEAKRQTLQPEINKGFFDGNVRVQVGDMVVQSPKAVLDLEPQTKKPSLATFLNNPYAFQEKGNKKHEIKADIIKVSLIKKDILASGKSQSIIMEDREPIVTVTADSQEYDTNTKIMKAHKGVIINYGKTSQAFANEAMAKINKKGDIEHLELTGQVVMKDKENVIKGNKFIYEPSREEYQINGNTVSDISFEDGTRVYTEAQYQQLNRRSNTMIAGGKVKVIYQDYTATGAKAQLFSNPKTNKPDTIIFTGRAKVQQGKSTVEADRIKMTMNPKAFFAEGNVKTSLEGDDADKMELMN